MRSFRLLAACCVALFMTACSSIPSGGVGQPVGTSTVTADSRGPLPNSRYDEDVLIYGESLHSVFSSAYRNTAGIVPESTRAPVKVGLDRMSVALDQIWAAYQTGDVATLQRRVVELQGLARGLRWFTDQPRPLVPTLPVIPPDVREQLRQAGYTV